MSPLARLSGPQEQGELAFAQLEALWEANLGIVFLDPDKRFVRINQSAALMAQGLGENCLGRSFAELPSLPLQEDILESVLSTRVPVIDQRVSRAEGEWVLSYYPVTSLREEVVGLCIVINDITEFARYEQELRQKVELLSLAHDAIIVRDLHNRIRFWNCGAEELYQIPASAALGQISHDLLKTVFPVPLLSLVDNLMESGRWEGELSHALANGARITVESRWALQRDWHGRPRAILEINRDVSARKGMEAERNELLHREQAARAAAEASSRAKDEFLAMLGHELRNPLAPIVTALELMRLKGQSTVTAPFDNERQVIDRQVRHLIRLVDDLLDISRITQGKVELRREPVELASIVTRSVEMIAPLLQQKAHRLVLEVPERGLRIFADDSRMAQVFANLISNAAKYTQEGGLISVSAGSSDNLCEVFVKDTGVGLTETLLPRVFELFTQGERTLARSEGGLGLGLAIVKSLVESHGGSVAAFSEGPGAGSTFRVRLPLLAEDASHEEVARAETCNVLHQRVLVVDDNVDAADLLAEALESVGYTVKVAYDGVKGLEAAAEFMPHTVLLDIGLPVMDGYEVAKRLRASSALSAARLIAVTGYGQRTDRQRALASGFDDHLVKPIDLDAVLQCLNPDATQPPESSRLLRPS